MLKEVQVPQLFLQAYKFSYEPHGFICTDVVSDKASEEYGACQIGLNEMTIMFRISKITPTKIGQFVTFWKREKKGDPIKPYDLNDSFDFLVVVAQGFEATGQFIFPKQVLYEKGVLSKDSQGGKRAIRVYPPWDKPDNSQARKTQAWQVQYFAELYPTLELSKTGRLLQGNSNCESNFTL